MATHRLLLAGGGHSHVEVLRRFAAHGRTADVGVVSPHRHTLYSGMLPGIIAGHYAPEEARIDVAALAARAGAHFTSDRVAALDLEARIAHLQSGAALRFDTLSLDVGSAPASLSWSSAARVVGVKPAETLLDNWGTWLDAIAAGEIRSIAVIGGGAGGIEVLLAMHHRLKALGLAPDFTLVSDRWSVPRAVQRALVDALERRNVRLAIGSAVVDVRDDVITLVSGAVVRADRILVATSAGALPWIRASGLACDADGFALVDDTLRSGSHPFVFASGDCAAIMGAPRPKAGVFAVRQGPYLAHNLRATVDGGALRRYRPQRAWLAIVTTGGQCAIATRSGLAISGRLVWRWKDRIDRAFIARYRVGAPDDARTEG